MSIKYLSVCRSVGHLEQRRHDDICYAYSQDAAAAAAAAAPATITTATNNSNYHDYYYNCNTIRY